MSETIEDASSLWPTRHKVHTGGLFGVGFAVGSDLLLVASHAGRGVIDCLSGTVLARDRNEWFPFDEHRRKVAGIGPIAGQEIVIAGAVFGGSLSEATDDGWRLSGHLSNSSDDVIQLVPPSNISRGPGIFTGFVPEVRVFGFSPTGRTFVIGTGADVSIFAR